MAARAKITLPPPPEAPPLPNGPDLVRQVLVERDNLTATEICLAGRFESIKQVQAALYLMAGRDEVTRSRERPLRYSLVPGYMPKRAGRRPGFVQAPPAPAPSAAESPALSHPRPDAPRPISCLEPGEESQFVLPRAAASPQASPAAAPTQPAVVEGRPAPENTGSALPDSSPGCVRTEPAPSPDADRERDAGAARAYVATQPPPIDRQRGDRVQFAMWDDGRLDVIDGDQVTHYTPETAMRMYEFMSGWVHLQARVRG